MLKTTFNETDFRIKWVLGTTAAYLVSSLLASLAFLVAPSASTFAFTSALIAGAANGIIIGCLQWIILRPLLPKATSWIRGSFFGYFLGRIVAFGNPLPFFGPLGYGLILGLSVGWFQSNTLAKDALNPKEHWKWIWPNLLGWELAFFISGLVRPIAGGLGQFLVEGLVVGLFTGECLLRILRDLSIQKTPPPVLEDSASLSESDTEL